MRYLALLFILIQMGFSTSYAQTSSTIDYSAHSEKDSLGFDVPSMNLEKGLLIANLFGTTAAGIGVLRLDPQHDKQRHFLAGYVIGNVANGGFQLLLPATMEHRRLYSTLLGFATSLLAGIGKEVWDSMGHGTPEVNDALATGAGGIAGTLTISFDLDKVIN